LVESGAIGVNSGGLVEQIAETLFPQLECLFSPHDLAMPANGVVLLEYCSPSIMSQLLFETPSCQTARRIGATAEFSSSPKLDAEQPRPQSRPPLFVKMRSRCELSHPDRQRSLVTLAEKIGVVAPERECAR
jgi:hypothetical protein